MGLFITYIKKKNRDTWVVKFDSDLNEEWVFTYGNEYGNGG